MALYVDSRIHYIIDHLPKYHEEEGKGENSLHQTHVILDVGLASEKGLKCLLMVQIDLFNVDLLQRKIP
jgi:hypothetical protein